MTRQKYEVRNRTLTILVDSHEITGLSHVRLTGRSAQSLYPYPYFLRIWNAPEAVFYRLKRAKALQVMHGDTMIAAGDLVDITREVVEEGNLMIITFALGYHFWNAWISMTVGAGATAGDTVRQLLAAAGVDFQLLNEPEHNLIYSRSQTFFGRLPEAISEVLSACGVWPYLLPDGIALQPADDPTTETVLDLDTVSGPWIRTTNTNPRI